MTRKKFSFKFLNLILPYNFKVLGKGDRYLLNTYINSANKWVDSIMYYKEGKELEIIHEPYEKLIENLAKHSGISLHRKLPNPDLLSAQKFIFNFYLDLSYLYSFPYLKGRLFFNGNDSVKQLEDKVLQLLRRFKETRDITYCEQIYSLLLKLKQMGSKKYPILKHEYEKLVEQILKV